MRARKGTTLKTPLLAFIAIIGVLTAGALWFIQSSGFAGIVKRVMSQNLLHDLGIDGDFSEFTVKLFPPGLSINRPRIVVNKRNFANLPDGSNISAERIDLNFYPLQLLSGSIRVHEAVIVNGDVRLVIDPSTIGKPDRKKKSAGGWGFNWDELFQVRAEAVAFENTRVSLQWTRPKIEAEFIARALRLGQWTGRGGLGYELDVELESVRAEFPPSWRLPRSIDRIRARVELNALGARVEEIALWSPGVNLSLSGTVGGNLLDPKSLDASGTLKMDGELDRILMLAAMEGDARGQIAFDGSVSGDLLKLERSLKLKGRVSGRDIRFQRWEADELTAEGEWKAPSSHGFGAFALTQARIATLAEPRRGAFRPARGGVLKVGAFTFQPETDEPVRIPVELENAHLHWLAAPVIEDIYGLDFRVSGSAELVFTPPSEGSSWLLGAELALDIPRFQLDNQAWRKRKPLQTIVTAPSIRLEGGLSVDARGFELGTMELRLPNTKFNLEGKVRKKRSGTNSKSRTETVFGLKFSGDVDLDDIESLADTEFRGKGKLSGAVHGSGSEVVLDFDPDLKNVFYLNLHLGDVTGRVSWDNAKDKLRFTRMKSKKGETEYQGGGVIDLVKDSVQLGFDVTKGDVGDLIEIFGELTKDLWWFPESLVGKTSGRIEVGGGLSMDRLAVMGDLQGEDWDFAGEKFRRVSVSGGYDKGRYRIRSFNAKKNKGSLSGRIEWDEKKGLDWDLSTRGLEVSDFSFIARLDVPFRGDLSLKTSGQGQPDFLRSRSELEIMNFVVRGVALPSSDLKITTADGKAMLTGTALGGQGLIDATYDFREGAESRVKIALQDLDFSPVLLLLNPRLIRDARLQALASGGLDLKFRTGKIELADGKISLSKYVLAKTGAKFDLVQPVELDVNGGSFDIRGLALRGSRGEARLDLASRRSELDGRVSGDFDVNIAEFLTAEIASAAGLVSLDFKIDGNIRDPDVTGRATVRDSEIRMDVFESPLENVRGVLQLDQNVITVRGMRADISGGKAEAKGAIVLYAHKYPEIDLVVDLADGQIKAYPFQSLKVDGGLQVKGDQAPYPVSGEISVKSALIKEKVMNQGKSTLRKSARYTPPAASPQESDLPLFRLDIHAKADRNVVVQNDLFDAELKGDVRLLNTIAAPRLTGISEIIQGKMRFKDREFQIESGRIEFDNPTVINPRFDLTAVTDVNNIRIRMFASGRLDNWRVELSSAPVMPESEILNLLALGFTSDDLQRVRAGDREVLQRGEAASLVLHSLDFNREVQDKTGLQIRLDEAVDTQTGTSAIRPATESDASAAPKIVIKRKIGKRLEISAGSTVPGVGTSSQQSLNAEMEITPGFSVRGVVNSMQGTQTSDSQAPDTQTSMGFDLKFQKRFK